MPLLDKNNKLISNENIDNIKNYIENVTDVTQTVRSVNDLNVAIKDFEFYTPEVGQEKLMIMTKVTKLLVMIYIKMGYLMITIMK